MEYHNLSINQSINFILFLSNSAYIEINYTAVAKHSTNDNQCDFCACLCETSSSMLELILLRAILMSFATLRRLRYVVLILTKADMAALQRYAVGNGINASRALFANSRYSCNILHQNLIGEEELNLVFAA